jgi:F-type H+-transporting ATPase subunit b
MFIDWVTVAAQIINFLVLIWLLKRFLYRPILDGIDQREAGIAARIASAETARSAAEEAEETHRAALATLAEEKATILEAARVEATTEQASLRLQARETLDAEQADWRSQIGNERAAYLADLRATGAEAILSLTGKALKDLADARLEDQIAGRLESQLAEFGPDLQRAAASDGAIAVSSFPLTETRRKGLRRAFQDAVKDVPLTFRTDPKESPGLTLQLGGVRLGWTVATYIDGLEEALRARLEAAPKTSGETP